MFSIFNCSVEEWAKTFGDELYFMARNMTKVNEIKDVSILKPSQFFVCLQTMNEQFMQFSIFRFTEIQAIQYTSSSKR